MEMNYKEAARRIREHNRIHGYKERNAVLITAALDMAADTLEKLSTGDIKPVKHGHWKKDTMGYDVYIECSECGTSLSMSNYIEEEWRELMRYCPNCGARMDGGAADENS